MKITRICAGYYTITEGELELTVQYRDDLSPKGWQVVAEWERCLYSDIIPTYREAKMAAVYMIEQVVRDVEAA